jgi:nitroreductase
MEFYDVVRARRMVRKFTRDPVDPDALERIVTAALRGPSAGFSQGIDVVVVTEPDLREKVLDAVLEASGAPFRPEAPVLIVVTADETRYHETYAEVAKLVAASGRQWRWPVPYWFVDAGAAMGIVLLAAVNEGLAAGVLGHPDHVERLQAVLGLPANAVPVGVLTVGHADEDPAFKEMFRKMRGGRQRRTDAVHRDGW